MKKTIVRKWVKALRSGKYEQGTGQLYNPVFNRYCCLGVLNKECGLRQPGENGRLSENAKQTVGMEAVLETKLIQMNDGIGNFDQKNFQQIASYLERKFLKPKKTKAKSKK